MKTMTNRELNALSKNLQKTLCAYTAQGKQGPEVDRVYNQLLEIVRERRTRG